MSTDKLEKIMTKIKEIIVDQLDLEEKPEQLKEEAHFIDDLGADSLDLPDLVMAVEDLVDLEVDDEEAQELTNIKKIRTLLEQKIKTGELKLS